MFWSQASLRLKDCYTRICWRQKTCGKQGVNWEFFKWPNFLWFCSFLFQFFGKVLQTAMVRGVCSLVFINNMFWFCVMSVITYTLNDLGMSAAMLVTYNQFRGVYRAYIRLWTYTYIKRLLRSFYTKKAPSLMFDRVLNTPAKALLLQDTQYLIKPNSSNIKFHSFHWSYRKNCKWVYFNCMKNDHLYI